MGVTDDLFKDLETHGHDKNKTRQFYIDEMTRIQNQYGGQLSDVPADKDHPYWDIRTKLMALERMKF